MAYAVSLGLDRFRLGQVYRQVRLEGFEAWLLFEAFGYRFVCKLVCKLVFEAGLQDF